MDGGSLAPENRRLVRISVSTHFLYTHQTVG